MTATPKETKYISNIHYFRDPVYTYSLKEGIRDGFLVLAQQKGACKTTVIFSLPLGSELAKRLSSAAGMEVSPVSPRQFRVYPSQRILRTIEDNFIPGISRRAAVVLSVRNWNTGTMEDWVAYSVRPTARSLKGCYSAS